MIVRIVVLITLSLLANLSNAQEKEQELWAAAKKGDAVLVKSLLEAGIDANAKTNYGATAITFAADRGHLEVVRTLLENGADVNIVDSFYDATAVVWAAYKGHLEIINLMIEHGADLSKPTPIQWASAGGNTEVVKTMLKNKSAGGKSVLMSAIRNKNSEMALAVLEAAELEVGDLSPALSNAKANDMNEVVKKLAEMGVKAEQSASVVKVEQPEIYTGSFEGENFEVIIEQKEDQLFANVPGQSPFTLVVAAPHVFNIAEAEGITFTFSVENGKAVGFKFEQSENTMEFVRAEEKEPAKMATSESDKPVETGPRTVEKPENWTGFRGNQASGIADGQYPPTVWNAEEWINISWKTPIPGLAHSSPIIWQDKIFITTAISSDTSSTYRVGLFGDVDPANDFSKHSWRIYCLDKKSGEILWEKIAYEGVPRAQRHIKATQANSTPVTDGKHVVALFGSEGLACYSMDGNLLWKKDLGVLDAGWFFDDEIQWGHASSPIIYKNLVIVQCDRSKNSYIAAYSINDGKEVWKTERDEIPSWGTPTIYTGNSRDEMITNSSRFVYGHDPMTGKELWRHKMNSEVTVGTPVAYNDLIYVTAGYPPSRPVIAIRPGKNGDISIPDSLDSDENVAWRVKSGGTYMPTPIAYDGYLYTCSNNGILTCYEAKTGKKVYRDRIAGRGGVAFTASPVAADGKLYFASEDGDVYVVKSGANFELIAKNIVGEICMATPAISDGMIFIRGQHHVFGMGGKTVN